MTFLLYLHVVRLFSIIYRSRKFLFIHIISKAGEYFKIGLNNGDNEPLVSINSFRYVIYQHFQY